MFYTQFVFVFTRDKYSSPPFYKANPYLFLDIDKTFIKQCTQIKISNSKLMIELGRHNKTDINNRICPLCKNGVEDEYYFMLQPQQY